MPILKTAPLVALLILLSACAASVNVDYDRSFDFSKIRTYTVMTHPTKKSGDAQIDNELIVQRIVAAIDRNMAAKGYVARAENPDVKLDYFISKKTGVYSSPSSMTFGMGSYGYHGGFGMAYSVPVGDVQTYEKGVLTINIVDARKNTLLWTGSSSRILGENATPETIDRGINEIVADILAKFPPGGNK